MMKLTQSELDVLGSYRFHSEAMEKSGENRKRNEKLLCIKQGVDGVKQLGTVDRTDVTCWNMVLKFFGFGKLSGVDLTLRDLSDYLCTRDVEHLNPELPSYQTIHALATRTLFYRTDGQKEVSHLWKKLSCGLRHTVQAQEVHFTRYGYSIIGNDYYPSVDGYAPKGERFCFDVRITPLTRAYHIMEQVDILGEKQGIRPSKGYPDEITTRGAYPTEKISDRIDGFRTPELNSDCPYSKIDFSKLTFQIITRKVFIPGFGSIVSDKW